MDRCLTDSEGVGLHSLADKYRKAKLITEEFDDLYNYVETLVNDAYKLGKESQDELA